MTISEPTLQGFIDYVRDEPSHKEIDHESWNHCAVGQYLNSCGAVCEEITEGPHTSSYSAFAASLPQRLYEKLAGQTGFDGARHYGELQIYIAMHGWGKTVREEDPRTDWLDFLQHHYAPSREVTERDSVAETA